MPPLLHDLPLLLRPRCSCAAAGFTCCCLLLQMCDMRGPAGFVKVASTFVSSALGLMDTSKGHPANTAIMAHAGGGHWAYP